MKGKSLHFWKADLEQAEMRKNQSAPEATIDINERGKVVVTFKRDGAAQPHKPTDEQEANRSWGDAKSGGSNPYTGDNRAVGKTVL